MTEPKHVTPKPAHPKHKPPPPATTTTRAPKPKPKPPSPPPSPSAGLGSVGIPSIDQWDQAFLAATEAVLRKKGVQVDPRFLKAMMVVESGGDGNYKPGQCRSDGSCGPMQIKQIYHQYRCPECNFGTVPGQIELAAHIIGDTMRNKALDEYGALLDTYFPTDDILNGTTQAQYTARVKDLVATMGGTTPAQVDVIDAIMGGVPYTDDYGFKSPTNLPYYAYFAGHGGSSNQHTGIDVVAPLGTPLYSPLAGTVVCAGTGVGPGAYGSSCAAFGYTLGTQTGSSGRFEILADDGKRSLILGHVIRCHVSVGQKVKPGQHCADLGGQNGAHVHVEARLWQQGNYVIVDPRKAFGGVPYVPPVERIPYNFDVESQPTPNLFTVRADKEVHVYQRADPRAQMLDTIKAGEEFEAVAVVPGNDGKPWWLGRYNGRVPVEGTSVHGVPGEDMS